MVFVFFIRHGFAVSNQQKILSHDNNLYPLTEEGEKQAKSVANELKKVKISKIYTSPVLRAYQTARIIGDELGLIPIIDDRLKERYLGELNNRKFDLNEHWKLKLIKGQIEVKGIENWSSMQKRMIEFINSLKKDDGIIVAVSHYDPIRSVIGYILGLDDISAFGISIPYASITVIEVEEDDKMKIHSIGAPILTQNVLERLNRYFITINK